MNKYVSPAALADLEEIWDFTCTRWNEDQADEYVRDLQVAMERLADNPRIGRACDDVRAGYRSHRAGSHTLYYRLPASASSTWCESCTNGWTWTATSIRAVFLWVWLLAWSPP